MKYSIVQQSALERTLRLDAEFYGPEYLRIIAEIQARPFIPLTKACKVSDGNHMSISEHFKETGSIPYYRGQNINSDFFLENANPVYIPEEIFNRGYMKRSHFHPGDVLLSIVGTVGSLSLVTDKIQKSTGSCKIAILRPTEVMSEYIASFLMGKYGNCQIIRNTRGAVQTGLILEDMDQIAVFDASNDLQKLIANVVKASLSKNRECLSLYQQSEQLILTELGLYEWKPTHYLSFTRTFSATQSAERIDAEYFQPKYDEIVEAVKQYEGGFDELGNLVKIRKSVEPGSDAYQESGVPFVRVSNLSKFELSANNQQFIAEQLYEELKSNQPKKGEILLSKDATPGVAYLLNEEPNKMIVSGGILRLLVEDSQILPEYLTLVLNSVIVQKQIERDAGGSIISHWRPDQVKKTIIPKLKDGKQREIVKLVEDSFARRKQAQCLLELAKHGVEKAIEENETAAMAWIKAELAKLGVTL